MKITKMLLVKKVKIQPYSNLRKIFIKKYILFYWINNYLEINKYLYT